MVAAVGLFGGLGVGRRHVFAAGGLAMGLGTRVGAGQAGLRCSRPVALLLSLGTVTLVLAVVATAVIPPFVDQFDQLLSKLPAAAETLLELLRDGLARVSLMLALIHL